MGLKRLIIFDFDGTLADTRRNIVLTMQQTMTERHLPVADEAACAATIGLPLDDCFRQIYPHLTDEEIAACAAVYRRLFEVNKKKLVPSLFPYVRETLQRLHQQGYVLTIASSRSSASLNDFLRDMNLSAYISYIVGADDVTDAKPHPEPVLKTLKALGIPASEALVVGDMPVDIMMGRNAGTQTCAVTYGNATRQQLEAAGADFIIDNMKELIEQLR